MAALFDLSGKVAIVTGASRGIGRAIAHAFAEHGAKVVVTSRYKPACQEVADEIFANGGNAVSVACNVSYEDQLQSLVDETLNLWGHIDVLVCNAAANPHYGSFLDITDDAFDKTMNVNVRSIMRLARMVLPNMQKRRDGSIIVISSTGALRGSNMLGTYNLTKIADLMLVKNLCVSYGKDNIRCNAIAPGLVQTNFARELWENETLLEQTIERTPLKRIAQPSDIAGIAVYLASQAGAWTSGQTFVIDGGMDAVE